MPTKMKKKIHSRWNLICVRNIT